MSSLPPLNLRVSLVMNLLARLPLRRHVADHLIVGQIIHALTLLLRALSAPSVSARPLSTVRTAKYALVVVLASTPNQHRHATDGSPQTTSTHGTTTGTGTSCSAPRGGDNSGAHHSRKLITSNRRTVGIYRDGTTFIHEDNWLSPNAKPFEPKGPWRGTTTFKTKNAKRDTNKDYHNNQKVPRNNRTEGPVNPYRRALAPLLHRLVHNKIYSRQRHAGPKTVIELCCGENSRLGSSQLFWQKHQGPPNYRKRSLYDTTGLK
jgi:hypothetical protein